MKRINPHAPCKAVSAGGMPRDATVAVKQMTDAEVRMLWKASKPPQPIRYIGPRIKRFPKAGK